MDKKDLTPAVDNWEWDHEDELRKAKVLNHFSKVGLKDAWLTGDEIKRGPEYHLQKCAALINLCEAYDIQVSGLGIWGTCPIVKVDVRPSAPIGTHGKYAEIIEYQHYPKTESHI